MCTHLHGMCDASISDNIQAHQLLYSIDTPLHNDIGSSNVNSLSTFACGNERQHERQKSTHTSSVPAPATSDALRSETNTPVRCLEGGYNINEQDVYCTVTQRHYTHTHTQGATLLLLQQCACIYLGNTFFLSLLFQAWKHERALRRT